MCVQGLLHAREGKKNCESWIEMLQGWQNYFIKIMIWKTNEWWSLISFNHSPFQLCFVLPTCLWPNHTVPPFVVDFLLVTIFLEGQNKRSGNKSLKKKPHKNTREKLLLYQMVIRYSNGLLSKVVTSIIHRISVLENFKNRIRVIHLL